jgi:hypothetical protein
MDDPVFRGNEVLCGPSEGCEADGIIPASSVHGNESTFLEVAGVGSDAACIKVYIDIAGKVSLLTLAVRG